MRMIGKLKVRRTTAGFVLLEVIVAMVILGISLATIMRSFTLSLEAIRNNDAVTQATVLAEMAFQSLEAEPPTRKGRVTGSFSADGFPQYGYEVQTEIEKMKYRLKTRTRVDNLRELRICRLSIQHEQPNGRVKTPLEGYLILPPLERFSYESKFRNELFSASEGL